MRLNRFFGRLADRSFISRAERRSAEFPGIFREFGEVILLFPEKPDGETMELARGLTSLLGSERVSSAGSSEAPPLEDVEYFRLGPDSRNLLGKPAEGALTPFESRRVSIDLSPEFTPLVSALPLRAELPLRIGRDEDYGGSAYNMIIRGDMAETIRPYIEDNQ